MRLLPVLLFSLLAGYAGADTFQVEVEIPRLRVRNTTRPTWPSG